MLRAHRGPAASARDGQRVQQAANVRGAFAVTAAPRRGAGVLVDDMRFSGWTLAMVAGQLRQNGATAVYPLTLATAY